MDIHICVGTAVNMSLYLVLEHKHFVLGTTAPPHLSLCADSCSVCVGMRYVNSCVAQGFTTFDKGHLCKPIGVCNAALLFHTGTAGGVVCTFNDQ